MICPKCSSSDVRSSQRTEWKDHFRNLLGSQAYRCRKCRLRFHAPAELSTLTASAVGGAGSMHRTVMGPDLRSRRRLLRRLIVFTIFTVMFVIFWFYLRYLTTDRVAPDNSWINPHLPQDPSSRYAESSRSVAGVDVSSRSWSAIRAMYRPPSSANIQPETAGRGNG